MLYDTIIKKRKTLENSMDAIYLGLVAALFGLSWLFIKLVAGI
jgi:hypothetical protein